MEKYKEYFIPAAIVVAGIFIAGSVVYGPVIRERGATSLAKQGAPSAVAPSGAPVQVTVDAQDHVRGNASAKVTIVEFSDLQCPYCKSFHPTIQQALSEYGDKVRWVYKHFPLDAIHPQAIPAAEASECVFEQKGDQGFWTFTDSVFGNQERIGPALFRELAQQQGLDMGSYDQCVSSRKYQDKVQQDYQDGVQIGVNGTPASFVNGVPVSGAVPYATLKAAIDEALKQ
ncbi:MAG: DsbA family protein [bacterium]|nr:DsbA family protein [bacterium]